MKMESCFSQKAEWHKVFFTDGKNVWTTSENEDSESVS